MESRVADALKLKYPPVAISWTDRKPEGAIEFVEGRWGCVLAALGSVAEKGRSAVFSRKTAGCPGGAVGLGFGNAYGGFPGGAECFYRFIADGNDRSSEGRRIADALAPYLRGEMAEGFRHGEGYRKSPEMAEGMVRSMPMMDIPAPYVTMRPLAGVVPGDEPPVVAVFLADPDQVSALVILASYGRPDNENVLVPAAAGCQAVGIYAYREAASARPRAVVGLTDLTARKYLRRLGRDLLTVALPWRLLEEMEANVPGSFLEKPVWRDLREN